MSNKLTTILNTLSNLGYEANTSILSRVTTRPSNSSSSCPYEYPYDLRELDDNDLDNFIGVIEIYNEDNGDFSERRVSNIVDIESYLLESIDIINSGNTLEEEE